MTITNENARVIGIGDGVTRTWSFDFLIPEADQVEVFVTDTTGTLPSVTPIDPANYTITGVGDPDGGIVTYPKAGVNPVIPVGTNIEIRRAYPYIQEDGFDPNALYPPDIEDMGDKIAYQTEQLAGQVFGRALIVPPGSPMTPEEYVLALFNSFGSGGGGTTTVFSSATLTGNEAIAIVGASIRFYLLNTVAVSTHAMPAPGSVPNVLFIFKQIQPAASTLTTQSFDGVANFALGQRWQTVLIFSNGSAYYVLQNLIP